MYRLIDFDGQVLPIYNPKTSWPTPVLRKWTQQTAGGMLDTRGTNRAQLQFPYMVTYECIAMTDDDQAALRTEVDTWRGLVGEHGTLYRRPEDALTDDTKVQSAQARLAEVPYVRESKHFDWLSVKFTFAILEYWHGVGDNPWEFDSGILLDDGRDLDEGIATTFTVQDLIGGSQPFTNDGKVPSEDIFISVTCGSAPLEQIIISSSFTGNPWGFKLGQGGSTLLNTGETITVNTATYEVSIGGVNAYSKFSFFPTHAIDAWVRMEPGINEIQWVAQGGGGDSTLVFQWKPEYL